MKNNKLHIILTVCLAIAVVVLASVLALRGCGEQGNESSADVSVNTEVSETVSNNDVSTEVSEEISEEVSEEVSDPEVSVPEDHTHKYADTWKSNETDHWKECECGEKSDIASHTYGEWTTTKEATEDAAGSKKHTCTVCGHEETATIPALSHTHKYADTWKSNETDHWKECECGDKSDIASHTYGEWTTTKEATEETEGSKYHTCKTCGYKETVVIPALEHTHKYADTWKSNETDHWKECNCGEKSDVANHNYGEWTTTKEATEETEGSKYHTCKTCGYKETVTIPVLSHTHSFGNWKNNETSHWKECRCGEKSEFASHTYGAWETIKEATCTSTGTRKHTCTVCGYSETETVPKANHTYGDWKNNETSHWKECKCGDKSQLSSHTYGKWETIKEATCTTTGTKIHTCTVCSYNETATIPATGHNYGNWKNDSTNHWKECTKCGNIAEKSKHNYTSVVTPPTDTAQGYTTHTCNKCGYSYNDSFVDPKPSYSKGLAYRVNDDGVTCTITGRGTCKDTNLKIPPVIDGYKVTGIGNSAFYDCLGLTSITIPDSVTTIGEWAFRGCDSLTSITIPDSVTTIGEGAFARCFSLTSITIPDSVTEIGSHTFYECARLISITIPDSVTTIGEGAFAGCYSLTSITIPDSVTEINYGAFYSCNGLTSVTIGNSVTTIGEYAFKECTSLTSITIPNGVTTIGYCAFSGCFRLQYNHYDNAYYLGNSINPYVALIEAENTTITSCVIHPNTKVIYGHAFNECTSLTSITIPDSVTTIGEGAFSGCSGLTSVTFKDTSGWYVTETEGASSGTNVNISDSAIAAKYLKNTYDDYYWYKK